MKTYITQVQFFAIPVNARQACWAVFSRKSFVRSNECSGDYGSYESTLSARERILDFLIDPSPVIRYADVNSRFVRPAAMLTPAG